MRDVNVPDLLSFSRLQRAVGDIKARADVTRTEAVTGRYEDITAANNGDVGGAHLLQKAVDDVKAYQENLLVAENRATRTQTVLGNLNVESTRISTNALAALGRDDQTQLTTAKADARASITGIFASLNIAEGGRSLFGGDVTDRAPLASPEQFIADITNIFATATDAADAEAQLDTYFNDPAGGFSTTIYQGGENKASAVEIAPGVRLDASAKADNQAIKDLLRGLAEIATADAANFGDTSAIVDQGARRTLTAETSITELRSTIGVSEARIGAFKARYDAEEAVLTSLFNAKTARDPYEASTELQLLESQLEASYLLTARLARLNFANFIG